MPKRTVPDSPSPYEITFKNGYYCFTTNLDREYSCAFSDVNPVLSPVVGVYDIEVFTFDFFYQDPDPKRKPTDERVSATIKFLLQDFFVINPNRVMIYVCDSIDGRGRHRYSLFKKWFENFAQEYKCDNVEIELDDYEPIYGAVIRSNEFQHDEILKTEVIDRAETIMTEKYGQQS